MEQKYKKKDRLKTFYAISLAWQLGFLIIFSIGGFLILGYLLDLLFKTLPFFVFTGLIIGLIITIYEVYHFLLPLINNDGNHKDD